MTPRIGVPRVYGPECPVIYPGEQAFPQIDQHALRNLLALCREVAAAGADVLEVPMPVTGWIIEPMAGWRGRWLRLRYRCWGQWFSGGPPRLDGEMAVITRADGRPPR